MIYVDEDVINTRLAIFFGDEIEKEETTYLKIYNDGSHFVGSKCCNIEKRKKEERVSKSREDKDILFSNLYDNAVKKGIRGGKMYEYIDKGIKELYPDHEYDREYMTERIKRKKHNMHVRFKRFRRKAYLNKWNYFVTFTYDDRKQTEESFRTKIRKCLSNLHTRRGWRYMGVFEYAPGTNRLHFHGLFFVPDGQMIGEIYEKRDYSIKQKKMQVTNENTFFETYFGRNDFSRISAIELKYGRTINYILKYIEKQGERIVYSRGIPSEVVKEIKGKEIICEMIEYVKKYILRDDVIDWERDVLRYEPKQLKMNYIM